VGEFLGECAAEGDPKQIYGGVAERIQDADNQARQGRHPHGLRGERGSAGSREVDADGLDGRGPQRLLEGLPHLQVRADAGQ
jgi:hypothetical protein